MAGSFFDRRDFLRSSFTGAIALSSLLHADEELSAQQIIADPRRTKLEFVPPKFNEGKPDTLFLTWLRDPTTTMTVSWVGEPASAEACAIEYAPRDSDQWQPAPTTAQHDYPAETLKVFRAEITGLEPDRQYKFRIGKSEAVHYFQTMPAKATNTFQFVSGGDAGPNSLAIASNKLAAKQDPKFVLIGGDLAYDDGYRIQSNLQFLRNYTQHMLDSHDRLIPLVVAIGNHEVTRIDNVRYSPFFQALYDGLFAEGRTYATLDFGDYLSLVILDTNHMVRIEGEQTDWLDRVLAERTDRPHLLVAQHVPSYPSYRSFDSTGEASRVHWIPLFQKYNVDLVLEHHDHLFKRTHPMIDGLHDKNGLVYLGDGSWGMLRPLRDMEKRPYLATASSSFHITLHRIEGEQRFHMALANDGRVADVLMTSKRPSVARS